MLHRHVPCSEPRRQSFYGTAGYRYGSIRHQLPAEARKELGTGHANEVSPAEYTTFERATSTPEEVIQLLRELSQPTGVRVISQFRREPALSRRFCS
jgi:hypothetical protein